MKQLSFRAGRTGNWDVLSFRCDTGARDANGVAETMSTVIGEHPADDG